VFALKDRLLAGGIAGLIATVVQNIYGLTINAVGLTDRTFEDFAEIMITFKSYTGIAAFIVGVMAHLAVGLIFGVIFAYLIKETSSKYYIAKGLGYGLVLWFLLSGFGTIFRLPFFKNIPPGPALYDLVGGLLFGFVLAYALKILDARTKYI
jgi:uncharacterized membrane protein YagU involved in acid resistance